MPASLREYSRKKKSWEKAHGEEPEFELARLKICAQCNFNKTGSLSRSSEITHKDGTLRVVCLVFGVFKKNFSKPTSLEENLIFIQI